MNIELPDIFKMRNLIALILALLAEWGLSTMTGVGFSAASFALILVAFVVIAWLVEKLIERLRKPRDPF
ncbi:MAG: hypothetical protein AAFV62_07620 [Pseudomonadota bacterium]